MRLSYCAISAFRNSGRRFPILAQSSSITDLERAIKANPRDAKASKCLRHRASTARSTSKNRWTGSARHLQLDPKYADAAHNLALALFAGNRPAEALDVLDKHPSSLGGSFRAEGYGITALGRVPDAAASLRRAYELAPNNEDYTYDLRCRPSEAGKVR